ncbi:MAG: NADP-dependent malic enzyme [Gammaproteobacteria bacterium]|nr:NADP-dependent malic enzyme [Gammaproteobacteria bacterium]
MKIPDVLVIESEHRPGSLGRILTAIGDLGVVVEHLVAVRRDQDKTVWEVTVELEEHQMNELAECIEQLPNARLLGESDRVFDRHRGGKIHMVSKVAFDSLGQMRDLYTPGVARVCLAVLKEPEKVNDYTNLPNTVAIVTDGSAVLGLGNIGALAGLPVMEGKSMIYARNVGVSAVPILFDESDPEKIIDAVVAIAPSFGAIHLEDIASPACFRIEAALRERLDKPVLHDDQHGTAVVTLAALISASRHVGLDLNNSVVGHIGLGAAGIGIARLLNRYGVVKSLGSDLNETAVKRFEKTGGKGVALEELVAKSHVVIATTGVKDLIHPEWIQEGQMIFALSNPEPEIDPHVALQRGASFAIDGSGLNNALGFPALFRGALDARARQFTDAMLFAAAEKIAELAPEDKMLPDVMDREVHAAIAAAVRDAALNDK